MCGEENEQAPFLSPECDTLETLVHVVQICPNEGRQVVYPQFINEYIINMCVHEYVYTHNMCIYI